MMKRILLIGCPGSGKSTLAKRIGKVTSLPVIHLDTIYWLPNWERRSIEEFDELLLNELNKEKWVIDGNYNRTLDLRVSYCDLIIYFRSFSVQPKQVYADDDSSLHQTSEYFLQPLSTLLLSELDQILHKPEPQRV